MAISPFAQRLLRDGLNKLAGLPGDITQTQKQSTLNQFEQAQNDWRVRLSLAPDSNYLYNAPYNIDDPNGNVGGPGILAPLRATNGVIFPYTPQVQVTYAANYDPTDLVHSNFKVYQYKNSAVESISITANFTAQDTNEANYLLAVIHFFRSVTKMFYGQDENPINGTPPPVCFLNGFGTYQFNNHPLVVTNFTQIMPDKVDYIRAQIVSPPTSPNNNAETNNTGDKSGNFIQGLARLGLALLPGGRPAPPIFSPPRPSKFGDATYVPTEMQIQIQARVTINIIM
jgi:hypothetical protein